MPNIYDRYAVPKYNPPEEETKPEPKQTNIPIPDWIQALRNQQKASTQVAYEGPQEVNAPYPQEPQGPLGPPSTSISRAEAMGYDEGAGRIPQPNIPIQQMSRAEAMGYQEELANLRQTPIEQTSRAEAMGYKEQLAGMPGFREAFMRTFMPGRYEQEQQGLLQAQLGQKRYEDVRFGPAQEAQEITDYRKSMAGELGPQGGRVNVPGDTRGADYFEEGRPVPPSWVLDVEEELREWGRTHEWDFWIKPFSPPPEDEDTEEDYNYPSQGGYGGGSYPYPISGSPQPRQPKVDWRAWGQKFVAWQGI